MTLKLSELKAMQEVVTTAPENMTARQVAGQAITNIPSSAFQYGQDIYSAISDPIGTAKSIGELGLGIIQLVIPGEQANEKQAKAVGAYFANRYGGMENIKRTIANDPVGFLGDASILLTGGSSLASKVGPLKEVAEQARKVGQKIDPLNVPLTVAGKATSAGLSLTSGLGRIPIEEAYQAGTKGGKDVQELVATMRQKDSLEDIVSEAKQGVTKMASKRKEKYLKSMEGVKASTKQIDFKPIKEKILDIRKGREFKGETLLDSSALSKLEEIENAVNIWSKSKSFHTVEGLDALKKKIDNLTPEADVFGKQAAKGASIVEEARSIVNNRIKEVSPEYAKTMKAYEEAINLEKEIRKSLSLGNQAAADTSLRKLLSVMRNNVNTNFGLRLENFKKLEKSGEVSLTPSVAGASLSQLTPRGIQAAISPYGLGAAGYGLGYISPEFIALMAASSPRFVGEAALKTGQLQKFLPPSATTRQAGIIEQQIGEDKNLSLEAMQKAFNISR